MAKVNVAVLGAAGENPYTWLAQSLLNSLQHHPYFDLVAFVAERPEDAGRRFRTARREWLAERPPVPEYDDLEMLPLDGRILRERAGVSLVFSCLPYDLCREMDPKLAATGMPVTSDSPGLRLVEDIPVIVPEINPNHLSVITAQQRQRGWQGGFIVSIPLCTSAIIALSLKPLQDAFGVEGAVVTTLQGLSGAGPKGTPGLAIVDNVLPFIEMEEEKIYHEGRKMLGRLDENSFIAAPFEISSTCTRVAVTHGHTATVSVQCSRPVTVVDAVKAMRSFSGVPQKLRLPSAPEHPIVVSEAPDRPQPRLDREAGDGMSITVGRLRRDEVLPNGIKYVVSGHNMKRGTVGNNVLTAELMHKLGLLDSK